MRAWILALAGAYLRLDNGARFRDGTAVARAGAASDAADAAGECHQCYDSCNGKDEAFNLCTQAYYQTCQENKQILSFCMCEQDGFDYPYLNPSGPAGGRFQWKCCFRHHCLPD